MRERGYTVAALDDIADEVRAPITRLMALSAWDGIADLFAAYADPIDRAWRADVLALVPLEGVVMDGPPTVALRAVGA